MATENIIMAIVKKGGDRQEAHKKIRVRVCCYSLPPSFLSVEVVWLRVPIALRYCRMKPVTK